MRMIAGFIGIATALAVLAGSALPAQAQPTKVFVSAGGNDANSGTFLDQFRSVQAGIDAVANGGTVVVTTPGNFGIASIVGKSVTVQFTAGGQMDVPLGGQIPNPPANINIDIGPNDNVSFDDLVINLTGAKRDGIHIAGRGNVTINNSTIQNNTGPNVGLLQRGGGNVFVNGSTFNVTGNGNGGGIFVNGNSARTLIANSTFTGIPGTGLRVMGDSQVYLDNNNFFKGGIAVTADGPNVFVHLRDNNINANSIGLNPINGGTIATFGGNANFGNLSNGGPNFPFRSNRLALAFLFGWRGW